MRRWIAFIVLAGIMLAVAGAAACSNVPDHPGPKHGRDKSSGGTDIATATVEEQQATTAHPATPTPDGWTAAQEAQFITTFKEGEERLIAELEAISPRAREYAKPTSDDVLACMLKAVAAAYPADADKIIAEMWIDTEPDDTPLVDDQLSDAIVFADGVPECMGN